MPAPTLCEVFALIREWGEANGIHIVGVIFEQENGKRLPLSMVSVGKSNRSTEPKSKKISKATLRKIYNLVPKLTETPTTARAIKNKTDYDISYVYMVLRKLREIGRVEVIDGKFRRTT